MITKTPSKLKWDSEFFDINIGVIDLKKDIGKLNIDGEFELIVVEEDKLSSLKIENYKETFNEEKIIYQKKNK